MKRRVVSAFALISFVALTSAIAFGQVTSSLSGTVTDPTGAVVSGATVTVKNPASGSEFNTITSNQGTFSVSSLGAGNYVVVVTASGFKSVTIKDIEIDAGTPATIDVTLEVGQATETVVVQGGAQIIQTQTANITTSLNTNQIINLPLVSRNPVNFVTTMAGVNTPRGNRDSTINGLPESAIDITLDGINVQDNFNKTTDGLFVRVAPTLDSIEEVTVSTSNPEAVGGAMGAVQVKFVTRSGGNEFHGSLYEYHRNTALNSAYWFTNRDTSYNVKAAKNCGDPSKSSFDPKTMVPWTPDCRAPRAANLFHQFGGRVGGPILIPGLFNGRNRAFFFVNYEEFRQPTAVVRQRRILHPLAQQGTFRYGTGANARQVNVLDVAQKARDAGCAACTTTADPTIAKLLADIRNATSGAGGITDFTNPNLQQFTYNPSGSALTKRPTVRFDVNVTDKHKVELSWTYQMGRGAPDFLNNTEPVFPGFPIQGQQPSDRYAGSLAVRSTLSPTLVNEARAGLSGGPSRFNPSASRGDFIGSVANQDGFNLGGAPGNNATGIAILGINGPTSVTAPSRRNPLFRQFSDTLNWMRGAHNLVFGGQIIETKLTFNQLTLSPTINFGVETNDPANTAMFTTGNFPGASPDDLTNARNLYAVLTGRVTAINANARLDEETGQYVFLGNAFERSHQKEFGFFAQDSWRVTQNLTVNYGLRWEVQRPFTVDNSSYTTATLDDIWGASVPGALFQPGVTRNSVTQFIQVKEGTGAYNTDYKNFAPSLGFAWRIGAKDGWLKRIAGDGQTVLRGGYSIAYNRRGIGEFRGIISDNPGVLITTNRSVTLNNLGALPVLFREKDRLGAPEFQKTPTYPLIGEPFVQATNSVNVIDPNIKVPYSQSWTFGVQRELGQDTAIEVRYVGARNLQGWTTYNLNSVENNIVENGLLNEFKLAQANLLANEAAGRRVCPVALVNGSCPQALAPTFRYFGPNTGTSPLPITIAYLGGALDPGEVASYTAARLGQTTANLFTSGNLFNALALNNPNLCCASTTANTAFGTSPSYAFSLDNSGAFRTNALRAGLAANFMRTNPGLRGGANFTGNGGYSRYDALQIDLRRRLSKGLQVQANYQFAKAFESQRAEIPGTTQSSFRASRVNVLDTNTLRHAIKVNWGYELPIGRGKALLGGAGAWLDRLVGGWEFYGSGRVQSGQLFNFGNVNLVGMTMKDLREAFKLRFDDAKGIVYILPQDIIDNTIRAFNASATSATGYSDRGVPTGRYIAPASNANCIQVFSGQCAPQNVFVTGPKFVRFDLSLKKQIRLNERYNFELRAEFLNAFNNVNFFNPTGNDFITPSRETFMQVTTAYQDLANTNDPGGRLVQIVARFNF